MNASEKMNNVIDYIEANLTNVIDYDNIANLLMTNEYTAQKIFNFIFNISIAEYIRKRKLSEAGIELKNTSQKIIDIALKYGYGSPEAFTRAFNKFHGFNPNEAKKKVLKIQPILAYNDDLDQVINYEIVDFEGTTVYGYKINCLFSEALEKAPLLWSEEPVKSWLLTKNYPIFGVLTYLNGDQIEYLIGHQDVDKLDSIILPQAKYAVFSIPFIPGKGKEQLHKLFKLIGKSWLNHSYDLMLGNIEFEYYTKNEIKYYIILK